MTGIWYDFFKDMAPPNSASVVNLQRSISDQLQELSMAGDYLPTEKHRDDFTGVYHSLENNIARLADEGELAAMDGIRIWRERERLLAILATVLHDIEAFAFVGDSFEGQITELREWLDENAHGGYSMYPYAVSSDKQGVIVRLPDEKDRVLYKLRWS